MYTDSKLYSLQSFAEIMPTYDSIHNQSFRESILNFLVSKKYVKSNLSDLTQVHNFIEDKNLMITKNEVSWENRGRRANKVVCYGLPCFVNLFCLRTVFIEPQR